MADNNTAQNFTQRLLSISDLRSAFPEGSDEFIQHLFNITQDIFFIADGGDDLADQVQDNTNRITQNEIDILANAVAIAQNASDIADNSDSIAANTTAILQNALNIAQNSSDISDNAVNLSDHIADTTTHGASGDIVGNNNFADESIGGVVRRMSLIADAVQSAVNVIEPDVAAAPAAYDQAHIQTIVDLTNANKAAVNQLVLDFNASVLVLNNLLSESKSSGQMSL